MDTYVGFILLLIILLLLLQLSCLRALILAWSQEVSAALLSRKEKPMEESSHSFPLVQSNLCVHDRIEDVLLFLFLHTNRTLEWFLKTLIC